MDEGCHAPQGVRAMVRRALILHNGKAAAARSNLFGDGFPSVHEAIWRFCALSAPGAPPASAIGTGSAYLPVVMPGP